MEKFSAEEGWEFRMLDANLSPDRQVSHVDTLVTLGASVISSWSLDPNAVAAAYTRAEQQGIPVIGLNSEGDGVTMTVWWETSLCVDDGTYKRNAQWIAERKPDAKVIAFGGPPVPSIQKNTACFVAAAEAAGLEVLTRVDNTRDSAANAATMASDLLVRYPDVDAFWAYNDSSALGISASIFASGKSVFEAGGSDGIMVFGTNGDPEAIDAIREGRLTATWDPDYYAYGGAIVLAMKRLLEEPGAEQEDITVAAQFVTAESIDDFVPTLERNYTLDNLPLVE